MVLFSANSFNDGGWKTWTETELGSTYSQLVARSVSYRARVKVCE